ncbi:MAG: hypothetical protein ACOYT8_01225 [Candidatus Dependentiae bacterium]
MTRLLLALIIITSCNQIKSFDWFESSAHVYTTKIDVDDNQELADFLTEECKCPKEIEDDFFEKNYPAQWITIQSLTAETKNNLLKKILERSNDVNYHRLRSGAACLIAAGAFVDQTTKYGCANPLYRAAMHQDYPMSQFLLGKCANPNQKLNSSPPIIFWLKSVKMAELFAQYNTQFTLQKDLGCSVLHQVAAGLDYEPELITFYTQHGVRVNETNIFGDTAFHDLINYSYDQYEILQKKAKLLLDAGISLDISNNNNRTAHDLLDQTKKEKLIKLKKFIQNYKNQK